MIHSEQSVYQDLTSLLGSCTGLDWSPGADLKLMCLSFRVRAELTDNQGLIFSGREEKYRTKKATNKQNKRKYFRTLSGPHLVASAAAVVKGEPKSNGVQLLVGCAFTMGFIYKFI